MTDSQAKLKRKSKPPKRTSLTKRLLDSLHPGESDFFVWDNSLPGFGIRVRCSGRRSFEVQYRTPAGRQRRRVVGTYPTMTVDQARKEARKWLADAQKGEDRAAKIDEARTAKTVNDLAATYRADHLPKNRASTRSENESMLRRLILPKIGRLMVAEVRYSDIDRLHRSLSATPYRANRCVAVLSKMFSLAIKMGWCAHNPAKGIERFPEEGRERFLSTAEVLRLTEVLDGWDNRTVADAIRFLLLTGARRGEVLTARWDQFDWEAGVWTKPSAHTKQKKIHRLPLSAPALQLLSSIETAAASGRRRDRSEYVFPGRKRGQPLQAITKAWKRIRQQADLEDVRLHDLRHTNASILANNGMSLLVIGRMLGHTQPGTTARYAHLEDDPLRAAAERVGQVVTAGKRPPAEVVPLRPKRAR